MVRTWHSTGLQYSENCLRCALGCLSFSCKQRKIHGKFTTRYANKPVINHWTCNVSSWGSEVWLTVIPRLLQGENVKYKGLLLIWNLKVLSPLLKKSHHKSIPFWSLPCNCCVSWLLSRVNIATSQVESQFVGWQEHTGPLFSHWDFCPLIDRDVKGNGHVVLLTFVLFHQSNLLSQMRETYLWKRDL